ncbi:hypothetical protein EGW08_021265 [Elysia chlorotica]|uniref:Uncharacterized protein n=1 Tax=Elysia chlorotica TaxID=188477 RepID=A0A3S1B3C5_ELYCH|nr:hypothetical protein EGW08_021265 [Elysia chlorotica]
MDFPVELAVTKGVKKTRSAGAHTRYARLELARNRIVLLLAQTEAFQARQSPRHKYIFALSVKTLSKRPSTGLASLRAPAAIDYRRKAWRGLDKTVLTSNYGQHWLPCAHFDKLAGSARPHLGTENTREELHKQASGRVERGRGEPKRNGENRRGTGRAEGARGEPRRRRRRLTAWSVQSIQIVRKSACGKNNNAGPSREKRMGMLLGAFPTRAGDRANRRPLL